jgi:hypothetical protein
MDKEKGEQQHREQEVLQPRGSDTRPAESPAR